VFADVQAGHGGFQSLGDPGFGLAGQLRARRQLEHRVGLESTGIPDLGGHRKAPRRARARRSGVTGSSQTRRPVAEAMAWVTAPPCTWPSISSGLIARPTSCKAA